MGNAIYLHHVGKASLCTNSGELTLNPTPLALKLKLLGFALCVATQ